MIVRGRAGGLDSFGGLSASFMVARVSYKIYLGLLLSRFDGMIRTLKFPILTVWGLEYEACRPNIES